MEPVSYRQSLALDHLRWMAALAVLLTHSRFHMMGDAAVDLPSNLLKASTNFGAAAVVTFFVMSGLLVGGKLLSCPPQNGSELRRYAIARVSRLGVVAYPAIIFAMLLNMALIGNFGSAYGDMGYGCIITGGDVLTHGLFLNNGYFPTSCAIGPIWSLHNAAFYYLLAPAMLLTFIGWNGWIRLASGAVVVLIIGSLVAFDAIDPHATLPYFAIWSLGVLALYGPFKTLAGRVSPLVWAACFIGSLLASRIDGAPYFLADIMVALTVVLFFASLGGDTDWRAPSWFESFGAWAAGWSFSLYAFHAPVIMVVRTMAERAFGIELGRYTPASFAMVGLTVLLALAVGYGAYLLTERHTGGVRGAFSGRYGDGAGATAHLP